MPCMSSAAKQQWTEQQSQNRRNMKDLTALNLCVEPGYPDEVRALASRRTKSAKSVSAAMHFILVRPWLRYVSAVASGFVVALAVFYSLGVVAFGVALLFYTFSR